MLNVYEEEPQEHGEVIVIEPAGNMPSWSVIVEYREPGYEGPMWVSLYCDDTGVQEFGQYKTRIVAFGMAMGIARQYHRNGEVDREELI